MSNLTYKQAKERYEKLGARYDREYTEGLWTTNRRLAAECEDAYSAMHEARRREETGMMVTE